MLANGFVAQLLLRTLQDLIPEGSSVKTGVETSIWDWRRKGAYQVSNVISNKIELSVNPYEFAEVTFCDLQHLLNHATEHRAVLVNSLQSKKYPSPSWTLVTCYYWALFLALALTRMTNRAVVYLDKEAAQGLAAGKTGGPHAGTYRFELEKFQATSKRTLNILKHKNSHFHEVAWITVYEFSESNAHTLEVQSKDRKLTDAELLDLRALRCLTKVPFERPHAWQSLLRNAVNYRHGYAYRSVMNENTLVPAEILNSPVADSFEGLIRQCEIVLGNLGKTKSPLEAPQLSASLLFHQTLVLDAYCRSSFGEFCKSRNVDMQIETMRKEFLHAYAGSNFFIPPLTV